MSDAMSEREIHRATGSRPGALRERRWQYVIVARPGYFRKPRWVVFVQRTVQRVRALGCWLTGHETRELDKGPMFTMRGCDLCGAKEIVRTAKYEIGVDLATAETTKRNAP